jgi:hypothetical protein
VTLSMSVSGADRSLKFDWTAAAAKWASDVGPLAQDALKDRAPVSKGLDPNGPKPGRFRDSISVRNEEAAGQMMVVFYSDVPYAPFIVGDTRAHVITVRNARALHWVDATGDRFAQSVQHPGTKANEFAELALSPLQPLIAERFVTAVRAAMIDE